MSGGKKKRVKVTICPPDPRLTNPLGYSAVGYSRAYNFKATEASRTTHTPESALWAAVALQFCTDESWVNSIDGRLVLEMAGVDIGPLRHQKIIITRANIEQLLALLPSGRA